MVRRKRRDPRKGTGKKPKGSGRRLYTDENPKDTVRIKFATAKDARATVRKVKRVRKSYARKIQILTVGEQRARVMGKKTVASIFKSAKAGLRRANNAKKRDPRLKRAGVRGYNIPKRTPGHRTKSHIVVAKVGNKIKTIRFGQQGAKTAGKPKERRICKNESKEKVFQSKT